MRKRNPEENGAKEKTLKAFLYMTIALYMLLVILQGFMNNIRREEHIQEAFRMTAALQNDIQSNLFFMERLAAQITGLADLTNSRISILTENGSLILDSSPNNVTLNSYIYNVEVLEAKKGSTAYSISTIHGQTMINVATPPFPIGDISVILHLEKPLSGGEALKHAWFLVWLSITAFVFGIAFMMFSSKGGLKGPLPKDESTHSLEQTIARDFADDRISRLSTLFTGLKDGIILFDLSGAIQMINPQAKEFIGVDNEIFFRDIREIGQSNYIMNLLSQEVTHVMETKTNSRFDLRIDEDVILEVSTSPIANKYRPFQDYGILAILRDVTEIKEAEQQRVDFVTNVSHELRTPLTLISGFVETLREWNSISEEEHSQALDIISVEAQRLTRLISQLLELSHIEHQIHTDYTTNFNAVETISNSLPLIRIMAEKKQQQFTCNIPTDDAHIFGNEEWLNQIIYNLCENAVKYTKEYGLIALNAYVDKNFLVISIYNEGIAIPKKEQQRIFERFYRIDKARNSKIPGSGLGLALTEKLVKELSGEITLVAHPGKGNQFTVRLPLVSNNGET